MAKGWNKAETLEMRLRRKYEVDGNGCWNYTGPLQRDGYGLMSWHGKVRTAHRIAYLFFVGDVPNGLEIDHKCRNRRCCNPDHLEAVPHHINVLRGDTAKRSSVCRKGHPMDGYNRKYDKQYCKTCRKASCRAWGKRTSWGKSYV